MPTRMLYLMRHGETLFNVQKKNQGWCDAPLTQRGMEQARRAGRIFVERGIQPDHFYCSTSERASDTLEIVCQEAFGRIPPYERTKGLKEWNFGAFEGKDSYLNPPPPFGDFFVPYGGDSQQTLVDRMVTTLTDIMSRPEHESVLAVSHGAACANFWRAWAGRNRVEYQRGIPNCAVFVYEFDTDERAFSCLEVLKPDLTGL